MKGNMCPWREKGTFFWFKLIGGPYKKGWKTTKKATCVYEGQYVHMKGKSEGFWVKLLGCPPTKKAEKSPKKQLVFMKGNMCPWRENVKVFD